MDIEIRIRPARQPVPAGKLADAELHFTDGQLAGLKLVGFAVWDQRDGSGLHVSLPARSFLAHGERRHFAMLRIGSDPTAKQRIRGAIAEAYRESLVGENERRESVH